MTDHNVQYDNDLIRQIDEDMGWVEEDGSSPSRTADARGMDCKFLEGAFGATGWRSRETGLWSVCVLSMRGITTTILAKSFSELCRLYQKLKERVEHGTERQNRRRWRKYYSEMWERRYRKWRCEKSTGCECQLCRSK